MSWSAGVRFPAVKNMFLLFTVSRAGLESNQPPIQYILGATSPGVKRLGRKANHSPSSRSEVKNGGAVSPLPIRLHDVLLKDCHWFSLTRSEMFTLMWQNVILNVLGFGGGKVCSIGTAGELAAGLKPCYPCWLYFHLSLDWLGLWL
jgi:hypothetical protein